jgi:hypothetical protein
MKNKKLEERARNRETPEEALGKLFFLALIFGFLC